MRGCLKKQKEYFDKIVYLDVINKDTIKDNFNVSLEEAKSIFSWFEREPFIKDDSDNYYKVKPLVKEKVLNYFKIKSPSEHQCILDSALKQNI